MLPIISLGAGVQSTTLFLMACCGELPKPYAAIFADTGWEPKAVYRHLEWLEDQGRKAGIPIIRVSAGNIRDDMLAKARSSDGRFSTMPFFVATGGKVSMLKRQCTSDYKIKPIRRKIREMLLREGEKQCELWLGISFDEVTRMRTSDVKYIQNAYPLVERRMRRADCLQWLADHGFPIPPKSSCIGCPFHDDGFWRELKKKSPDEWQEAVEFDRAIRRLPRIRGECYMHRSAKPLDEVDFDWIDDQLSLFDIDCTGMCGV